MRIDNFFTKEQKTWLNDNNIDINKDFDDDEIVDLIETLEDMLQEQGFTNNQENEFGTVCADVLTVLGTNT
jgi:hypothetical protein